MHKYIFNKLLLVLASVMSFLLNIWFHFEQIEVVHQRTVESFNDNCASTGRLTGTDE